jgi:hypothetical protein
VVNEHRERAFHMPGVQHQEPIQAFCSSSSDEPLSDPIRLGYLNRCANDSDVCGLEDGIEATGELAIVVADQETNWFRPFAERPGHLTRLLRDPFAVGVGRDTSKMDATTAELDKEEDVQPLEPDGVDREESTARTLFACARKNSRHDGPFRLRAGPSCSSRRIFLTVVADTTMPRPFSSPTMR